MDEHTLICIAPLRTIVSPVIVILEVVLALVLRVHGVVERLVVPQCGMRTIKNKDITYAP